ncbi:MAG TPA: phosphotransferase family protein [Streptosporangiaceae bacterium]|jgi:aminoglycoside phosphotransferase (APT) family kinase protein
MSGAEDAGEIAGLDVPAVTAWLAADAPAVATPVEFALVSGGRSNLTYRMTGADGTVYALRRPPTGGVLSTAHDMSREWRFISALHPTAVPVPEPVAYCADTAVTGASFYVMGFVDGRVLADADAGNALPYAARVTAAEQVADVLAALHAVDPDAVGIGDIGRRTGYVERQLRRWHKQVHASGAPDLDLLDRVHDLLAESVPDVAGGIVHGDYRPGNMSFAPDGRILAIFDWELATLGDPMADVGWLVSTWERPGDAHPPTTPGPSSADGFPDADALAARYAAASGRDISDLPYYVAFSRWRSACIGAGVYARYKAGVMGDDGYAAEARADGVERQSRAAYEAISALGRT